MKLKINFFLLLLLSAGCETYHMSTRSLMQQIQVAKEKRHSINDETFFGLAGSGSVLGNNLLRVKCLDKNNDTVIIDVTNHTGIRIYTKDNSRTTFYFNTLLIKDSIITGSRSHFLSMPIHPIRIKEVVKIELQK